MRGRSSKTSVRPRVSSRMPALPLLGCRRAAATCRRVVLPAPFGPRITQRSPSLTSQSTLSSRVFLPRTTLTEANSRTSLIGVDTRTKKRPTDNRGKVTPKPVWRPDQPLSAALILFGGGAAPAPACLTQPALRNEFQGPLPRWLRLQA